MADEESSLDPLCEGLEGSDSSRGLLLRFTDLSSLEDPR